MAVGVASTGFSAERRTNIKFSELRRSFKTIEARDAFSNNDDYSNDSNSISISASELLRDSSSSNPILPDSVENASLGIPDVEENWRVGLIPGAVKFYFLNQTSENDNTGDLTKPGLDLDTPTNSVGESGTEVLEWETNISKNIKKWAFIDGTIGSDTPDKAALEISGTTKNLQVKIGLTGKVYGAGGDGGAAGVSGQSGGNAIEVVGTSHDNLKIYTTSTARVYAGGGGGGGGGSGGPAQKGGKTCSVQNKSDCAAQFPRTRPDCGRWDVTAPTPGAGSGGKGGVGRGWNNFSGKTDGAGGTGGSGGTAGSITGPCVQVSSGTSGTGGTGGAGGAGGDWGAVGATGLTGSAGQSANAGANRHHACNPGCSQGTDCNLNFPSCGDTAASGTAGPGGGGANPGEGGIGINGTNWYFEVGSSVGGDIIKGGYQGGLL